MLELGVKRQSDGRWFDEDGKPINVDRALAAGARQDRENAMDERFMARATGKHGGEPEWFVLGLRGGCEEAVDNDLSAEGVITYRPMKKIQLLIRGQRKRRDVMRPVWKGLIFVRAVPHPETWHAFARTKGVRFIYGSTNGPTALRDKEIEAIDGLVKAGAFDMKKDSKPFAPGATVMIKSGPFADFQAVLEGYVGTRHVRVRTHLFGGSVPLQLDLAQISGLK